jgi:hypothetical protein
MALVDEIKSLLKDNGVDWEKNIPLAKGIKDLVVKFSSSEHTVEVLKAGLFTTENLQVGCRCPVCNQMVKLYKPTINNNMALCLIDLYKLDKANPEKVWWHVSRDINVSFAVSGAFAKLRHWDLIEMKPKEKGSDKKRTSGMWKITETGKQFVEMKTTVQEHVKLFNATLYGLDGGQVDIRSCLAEDFDYTSLMSR